MRSAARVVGLALTLFLTIGAGTALAQTWICGSSTIELIAGQHYDAGSVSISNDATTLWVIYSTAGTDALITETHLSVAKEFSQIPQTKNGCPKNGQFQHSSTHRPGVTEVVFMINLAAAGFRPYDNLYVAAHAVVQSPTFGGQTAWGQGPSFPCRNWAMYSRYQVGDCFPLE